MDLSLLPSEAADDDALVGELTRIVNRAFALGEEGLWHGELVRIEREELAAVVRAGELAAARLDGQVVGCVRVMRLPGDVGELGLLAVSTEHRGLGVGGALVELAERLNCERGAAVLQLEHLVPRDGTHADKQRLAAWYARLGYRLCGRRDFATAYPRWASQLAVPCWLLQYRKLHACG